MKTLDQLDRRILFELDRNSRQPVSTLAKKLRQGRDRIEYRIDRLLGTGVISGFSISANLYKLGFCLFKTYLRLENNKKRVAELYAYLCKHPRIYWVSLSDGSWDLVVAFFAKSALEFYAMHSQVISEFNDVVLNFTAYTIVDFKIFHRDYNLKGKRSFIQNGGDIEHTAIDEMDFAILRLLSRDARIPALSMAERLNTSAALISYRIERLQKQQIIAGYTLGLNLPALNMISFKCQFFLRNYELSLRERFKAYCLKHPNVRLYIEQIGDCNVELELDVADYQEYSTIIEEIRGEYSKLVRNFNTILLRQASYFPVVRPDFIEGLGVTVKS